jgi:hypothetical protein
VTLSADLEEFVTDHRPHGTLTATTGDVTPNGYRLEVACPCGVVPSVFAVLRFTTSSKRDTCSTGNFAGLAPLRILST